MTLWSNRRVREAADRVTEVASRPEQEIVAERALHAVAEVLEALPAGALRGIAGARSNRDMLVRALEEMPPETAGDPLLRARLRGLQAKRELLAAEGGTLGVDEVAALLGVTRQAVDKRRRSGGLLGVELGRRGYAYPAWQFGDDGVLGGMDEALAALAGHDPFTQVRFFLSGNPRLGGRTPLECLRAGDTASVLRAAAAVGEHGAG